MKRILITLCMAAMCSVSYAQTPDTVVQDSSLFDHSEIHGLTVVAKPTIDSTKKLADNIETIANAVQDSTIKAELIKAAGALEDYPKSGGLSAWIEYLFGILAIAFGLYQYYLKKQAVKKTTTK